MPVTIASLQAYQACDSEDIAALLLQDITVRWLLGESKWNNIMLSQVVRSTSRRLGPVLSKKIHRFLTSTNHTTMLD